MFDIDIASHVSKLPFWKKFFCTIPRPQWLINDPSDGLARFFDDYPHLIKEGRAVWGHVIQANQLIYTPGIHNVPGEMLYDPTGQTTPGDLAAAAKRLYAVKGNPSPPEDLAFIAHYLDDECIRVFGLEVPKSLSPHTLRISTTYFCRDHLPGGTLARSFVPILVSDKRPGVVMPVPQKWWPRELREVWAS